jgi:colanic acid/amylovoran biosynthesis glycosyltransferase
MKICIFCHHFPALSQTFVSNQVGDFIKLGHEVHVMTNDYIDDNQSILNDIDFDIKNLIDIGTGKSKKQKILSSPLAILKLIFKGKVKEVISVLCDVHLTVGQKFNLLLALNYFNYSANFDYIIVHFGVNGYYVSKMRDLGLVKGKIATVFHGFELSKRQILKKYHNNYQSLFAKTEKLLPISENWKNKLLELGAKESAIHVLRMGIDPDLFLQSRSGQIQTPLRIVQIGRLTPKKGVLFAINAMAKLSPKIDASLTIVGEGELYNEASSLIKSLNLQEKVTLTGKMAHSKVRVLLENSDIFMLPSVTAPDGDQEGIPVAIMEAMAMGLIVISTYHSGIPELVDNNKNGFLVSEGSADEIADVVQKIHGLSIEKINCIRASAYEKVKQSYNYTQNNKFLLSFLNKN